MQALGYYGIMALHVLAENILFGLRSRSLSYRDNVPLPGHER